MFHTQVVWILLALPFLSLPGVDAFSLRAKHTRSNMTLHELHDMDYEAYRVHDTQKADASHGVRKGYAASIASAASAASAKRAKANAARAAKSWNHFQRKHHGKHKKGNTTTHQYSKPMEEEMQHDNPTHCDPPCTKHGVCNDNRCFCKTPWTGSTCQHQITVEKRVGYSLVVGFLIVSFVMGAIVATLVFNYLQKAAKEFANYGDRTTRRETWKPSEAETKSKKKGRS